MRRLKIAYGEEKYTIYYLSETSEIVEFIKKIEKKYETLGFDIETAKVSKYVKHDKSGLWPRISDVRLMQFYGGDKNIFVFDVWKQDIKQFEPLLKKKLIAHNACFEIKFMKHEGVEIPHCRCTQIMYDLVARAETEESFDSPRLELSLGAAAYNELGYSIPKDLQVSNWNAAELSISQIQYAALDAVLTYKLAFSLLPRIQKNKLGKVFNTLCSVQKVIVDMEYNGLPFNKKLHEEYMKLWEKDIKNKEAECVEHFGHINIASTTQLSKWVETALSKKEQKLFSKTATGNYCFNAKKLQACKKIPAIKKYLEYKKLQGWITKFGPNLSRHIHPVTGNIHASFWLTGVATGRMSSSNPNFQQMPRDDDFRKLFVAEKGHKLIGADFSQIEMRIQAECSQDPEMLSIYRDGRDIYKALASNIFSCTEDEVTKDQRHIGKACFSGDTEILTEKNGWVKLEDYNGKEKIAQFEIPTHVDINQEHSAKARYGFAFGNTVWDGKGIISFVKPLGRIRKTNKEVWNIADRNVDVLATPDHRILHVNAQDAAHVKEFQNCHHIDRFVTSGYYKNTPQLPEEWTRILAMTVADGHHAHGETFRFGFVKKRKCRRLIKLFENVGIKVTQETTDAKTSTGKVTTFQVKSKKLYDYFKLCTDSGKDLSWRCLHIVPHKIYLEEAAYWDGHIESREKDGERAVRFTTTSKQTAEVMQTFAHLSGIKCNLIKTQQSTDLLHSDHYSLQYGNFETIFSSVKNTKILKNLRNRDVYCVEVPSSYLLIRRNGKICVQGNCVLGLGYGMGATKFMENIYETSGLKITLEEAYEYWNHYHNTFKTYSKWCDKVRDVCTSSGLVRAKLGRLRNLHKDNVYTKAPNHIIQGSAALVLHCSMIHMYEKGLKGLKFLAPVHDELILSAPLKLSKKYADELEHSMVEGFLTVFPNGITRGLVDAATGKNWGEIH